MKIFCYISIVILFFSINGHSSTKILDVGEELNYRAYFGFIKLGEVKFKITSSYSEDNKNIYNAMATIKSYEGIPFVYVNFIFETTMEKETDGLFSQKFYSTEFKEDKSLTRIEYKFKYNDKVISVKRETDGNVENEKKIVIDENTRYQDGLSIFYHARLQSLSNKNYITPVYINERESSVRYSFNINKDVVSSDLTEYDVSVIKIAGVADFVGIFGLTGEFVGWFSDDNSRVPVKAQFNVKIGSISLELYSYKKKNWKPPKFEK